MFIIELPFREAAFAVTGIASAASNATKAICRIIGRAVRRKSIECMECRLRVICVGPLEIPISANRTLA